MTSEYEKYKEEKRTTKPWDMINPNMERVSEQEASVRYSICLKCPQLFKMTKQCKQCGCFMSAKTKLKDATCPIGKW